MMLRSRVEIAPQQRHDGAGGFVLLRPGHRATASVAARWKASLWRDASGPAGARPAFRRQQHRRVVSLVKEFAAADATGLEHAALSARAGWLSRALADGRSPWNAPPRSPAQGLFQAPAIGPRRAYLPWLGGAVLGIASRTACGPSWGRSVRFSGVAVRASLARSSDISAGQRHA